VEATSEVAHKAVRTVLFYGTSMDPTLRHPDILHVVPYGSEPICPGDIIVFQGQQQEKYVTHRVISVDEEGIRTQGDNSSCADDRFLAPGDVIGRVACIQRGSRVLPVRGGMAGRCIALRVKILRSIDRRVSGLLRPLYRRLSSSGLLRRCVPSNFKPRVLSVRRGEGRELQVLMGRHVVGRKLPGHGQWQIRRPFRLFIDESRLPGD
jgi:signal peptidase I